MTAMEHDVQAPLAAPFKRNQDILTEHGGRDPEPVTRTRRNGCPIATTHE